MSEPTSSDQNVGQAYLTQARLRLAHCHGKIRHRLDQLTDDQVWWRPDEAMNSIANIVLHLCGNVRQWIIAGVRKTADTRNRPQEFAERGWTSKAVLLSRLDAVVAEADAVLAELPADQLLEPRRIQGFEETVLSALFDCLTHFAGHTQEITYITRLQLGNAYQFAWKPQTPEQGATVKSQP
jgi:hypothetical protein